MKTRTILALVLVLSLLLGIVAMAETHHELKPMCRPGSVPGDDCIDTGDAYYECGQLTDEDGEPLDLDWAKRVGPTPRTWILMDKGDLVQRIELYDINNRRTEFSWIAYEEDNPIGAVLIKSEGKGKEPGGTIENLGGYSIYIYNPRVWEDWDLTSYQDAGTGRYYRIDHITFCWNEVDDNGDDECYQEETAWGDGTRYVEQGNWAMYFPYPDGPVGILAGQYMDAGYLTFGEPDGSWVEITITLENGFVFYYDGADPVEDENLKVQDYEDIPPAENPAIGHFDWKASIEPGSTTATITVPVNDYYGVHLDVAYPIECPEEE